MPPDGNESTPSWLRENIDRGRAGSAVTALDQPAVPLGADEEAAGTPVQPHAVRAANEHEVDNAAAATEQPKDNPGIPIDLIIMALLVAAISAIAVLVLF